MFSFKRNRVRRFALTLALSLALGASFSLQAGAQPAAGVIQDGKLTDGEYMLAKRDIERSFRPQLGAISMHDILVSSLTSDSVTLEASLTAPAGVTDGTSNTIMIAFKRVGFMDYTDDACMFGGAAPKTAGEALICGAVTQAWNSFVRAWKSVP